MRDKQAARAIKAAEVAEYKQNGVVKLPAIFDLDWIEYLRQAVDEAMENPGPYAEEYAKGAGRFFGDVDVAMRHWRIDAELSRHAGPVMMRALKYVAGKSPFLPVILDYIMVIKWIVMIFP